MKKRYNPHELNFGELPTLPSGWWWGQMANVATDERNSIVDGPFGSNLKLNDYIDPPGVPVLTTANLRGDYGPSSVRYISQSKFNQLKRSEVRGGDILVAKIGSCGLTGIYPEDMPSAIIPANLLKITVRKDYSRKFIFHYLNSPVFSEFLKKIITATAQPAFNVTKFRMLPMPLVCKHAQDTIVAELEKQLTRLEAGTAALKRVQANLKRYRATVLKAACEGRLVPPEDDLARKEGSTYETGKELLARILTERRRNWQGRGKYKEPVAPDKTNLPPLPEGWTWATVAQIGETTTGFTPPKQNAEFFGGDIPFFKPTDLDAGYYVRKFRDSLTEAGAGQGRVLPARSILVTCIGATIGKTGFSRVRCATNQQINALTVSPDHLSPEFVFWFFTSPLGQRQINENASATTLPILNKSRFVVLPIPIPPLAEQIRIVAEVERRLSVVEEQEAVVSANLQRAARLRQSILQRAFSGGLVYNGT